MEVKAGDKVRVIDDSINPWDGCDSIRGNLHLGSIYTLSKVDSWHTELYLEEVPERVFNSAHFELCEDEVKGRPTLRHLQAMWQGGDAI